MDFSYLQAGVVPNPHEYWWSTLEVFGKMVFSLDLWKSCGLFFFVCFFILKGLLCKSPPYYVLETK